ncbi:ATP-binding cassette subfamily C protein CydC [Roseibium hamelinense]|uniref:ATP-binding cassette subfamily C protein CydC n=1 Tax=Roseibium hamelinense TaxID=150831 RepID=A0A562T838_9HYPH|nr:thiol reductant ABC exporter subunit CydC [Roseibium hamelinense]MTI42836.1 thiol reductant ABC exporter subunit CydC [Roseibium hamelinense]TWI89503.1 ATP-binding cassette subfamily C protein CydC [Roseibium hamelinense]
MSAIGQIIARQRHFNPVAFWAGIAVAFVPALAGLALLGVAGWFITACAIAGLTAVFLNVFVPSALIRGLAIARTAGRYGERMVTHDATFRFLAFLRTGIFKGHANAALQGARKLRSGASLNRLTSDVALLDAVYLRLAVPTVVALGVGLLVCLWFAYLDWRLLAGLGLFAAAVISMVVRLKGRNAAAARRLEAGHEALRVRSVDLVAGRRDLAVYGGLDKAAGKVMVANDALIRAESEIDNSAGSFTAATFLAGQVYLAVMLTLTGLLVFDGGLPMGAGVAVLLVSIALPELVSALVPGLSALPRTQRAAARAEANLQAAETGNMDVNAVAQSVPSAAFDGGNTAVLAFDQVSFAYPGAGRSVLEAFDMSLAPGECVALVGRSGCGKSTVSALAAGLAAPVSGAIRLNGAPVGEAGEERLRKQVTVLTQKPYLFHDTVAANLRIANPDASEADMWEALERAALADRIGRSPAGLETVLGEGGLGLSGGEQRRLGLARAYLTRPVLWILDEMTEGLDNETANDVLDRFFSFKGDAAVLMIAHKPQEVARADRQVRLADMF